ncbi:MAG: hypothetical protein IT376_14415 [Polyangiaceae bacterium]|nr:hypothetical protein [Polyangiaceae bacterium]
MSARRGSSRGARRRLVRAALVLTGGLALACATIASDAGDLDARRPNALAGPFRELREAEDRSSVAEAPNVLANSSGSIEYADPCVLDLDGGGPAGRVALYVATTLGGVSGIYRYLADDARTFPNTPDPPEPVLAASLAWEGGALRAPHVLHVGDTYELYYSAAGGIGVATSTDGARFVAAAEPLLTAAGAASWEGGAAPASPAVIEVAPGDVRLFYEAGGRIGEAQSSDGRAFERVGAEPVLEPSAPNPAEVMFDDVWVGDPHAVMATSAEGRRILRVYYAGEAADGTRGIGLGGRFGEGRLDRAVSTVFSLTRGSRAPFVLTDGAMALLYVAQRTGTTSAQRHLAIALGVAPGDAVLP